jgi:hypothetical protein
MSDRSPVLTVSESGARLSVRRLLTFIWQIPHYALVPFALDIDAAIAVLQDELCQKAESVDHPEIQELARKIKHLKKTLEIASAVYLAHPDLHHSNVLQPAFSSNGNGNGHSPAAGSPVHKSQGDMVVEILESASGPLHINKIIKEMEKYGVSTNKARMIGIIGADRRGRFIRTGTSTFGLNPDPKPFAMSPSLARKRKNHPFPTDFSLIESIQKLLQELDGEFSQRTIFDILVERYPEAAPYIDRASIAKTLNRLKERGLIEMTYVGYGIEPRRYKRKDEASLEDL